MIVDVTQIVYNENIISAFINLPTEELDVIIIINILVLTISKLWVEQGEFSNQLFTCRLLWVGMVLFLHPERADISKRQEK